MMTATKVKLAVGAEATIVTVNEAAEVEGNYGPQARITGTTDDGNAVVLYEKLDAVNRQLSRIGLTLAGTPGERLAFWKETATNGSGQSFPALRIDTMRDGAPPAPAPSRTVTAAPTAKQPISIGAPVAGIDMPAVDKVASDFALYSRCIDHARVEVIRTGIDKLGGDVAGAVAAIAATLYIQAHK